MLAAECLKALCAACDVWVEGWGAWLAALRLHNGVRAER